MLATLYGEIITARAFDGINRYSIYSQFQRCDCKVSLLLNAQWPIVDGTGNEPTPAHKIAAPG